MPPDLAAAALDQVLELTTLLGADLDGGLAALGLTTPKAHLLFVLGFEGPQPQAALARALDVTPRTITTYVDDLATAGLVTREAHPTDRRATAVTMTAAGRELADGLVAGRVELAGQLFDHLPAADLEGLVRALGPVLERLRGLLAEQGGAS
jgi:DNA-binding MarR family transcriptional regulator